MGIIQRSLTSTTFQRMVNQKKLSAFMGWLSSKNMPPAVLKSVIRQFIKTYRIDMSQYEFNFNTVRTFNEFFIRKLKPGKRIFEGKICSGADGFVSAFGPIVNNQLFQVKGKHFPLKEVLGQKESFEKGSFVTIYLSPADYHRVHMPLDGTITGIKKIPGKLFSVNKKTVEKINNLYCRNERVVVQGNSEFGRFYLVMVGAIVVGKIKLSFVGQNLKFNENYKVNIPLKQGDELGYFELGSTILLIMESNLLENIDYLPHQKISMGNKLV